MWQVHLLDLSIVTIKNKKDWRKVQTKREQKENGINKCFVYFSFSFLHKKEKTGRGKWKISKSRLILGYLWKRANVN